jgi:hypothetical protein
VRGVGALWAAGTRPPSAGVARLLGPTRVGLLEALRSPATTTDLARVFAVTPSAVGQEYWKLPPQERELRAARSER